MPRPVTLFTGQWADMPISELAAKAGDWGFDGLELACWGDHFDVADALRDPSYAAGRRELLGRRLRGALSIEWEDAGMDREYGAQDALAFTRRLDFTPSSLAFDAAFAGRHDSGDAGIRSGA